jgi:hypothetical protein
MVRREFVGNLSELYLLDETAWLERMAELARLGDTAEMDHEHLAEYLFDMAKRDQRETLRRLVVLLVHLLKWEHQPNKRTRSWELTIDEQREELLEILESATLRTHAESSLPKAYRKAVRRAAVETELDESVFSETCPYTLEQILST